MSLATFFHEDLSVDSFLLNEETSKHVVQVLRMKNGEQLQLTDGKGKLATGEIISSSKKQVEVRILSTGSCELSTNITIAISLIKNSSRFEWFLEKATEIGVSEIVPMICDRTEKQHFRYDRMKNIVISAMLQSQQSWLPVLHEPKKFNEIMALPFDKKFIAHRPENPSTSRLSSEQSINHSTIQPFNHSTSQLILIGPEGDFTEKEIESAKQNNFEMVTLGETRLRTETAGVVAAVLLNYLKR